MKIFISVFCFSLFQPDKCGERMKKILPYLAGALLFSGVLGNLTDRLLHGAVIDFLSFDLHIPFANPWPSFNVADSCICIAAVLFVAASWKNDNAK